MLVACCAFQPSSFFLVFLSSLYHHHHHRHHRHQQTSDHSLSAPYRPPPQDALTPRLSFASSSATSISCSLLDSLARVPTIRGRLSRTSKLVTWASPSTRRRIGRADAHALLFISCRTNKVSCSPPPKNKKTLGAREDSANRRPSRSGMALRSPCDWWLMWPPLHPFALPKLLSLTACSNTFSPSLLLWP